MSCRDGAVVIVFGIIAIVWATCRVVLVCYPSMLLFNLCCWLFCLQIEWIETPSSTHFSVAECKCYKCVTIESYCGTVFTNRKESSSIAKVLCIESVCQEVWLEKGYVLYFSGHFWFIILDILNAIGSFFISLFHCMLRYSIDLTTFKLHFTQHFIWILYSSLSRKGSSCCTH